MTSPGIYKAKEHYHNPSVAESYDEERFSSWYGRMAHSIEEKALSRAVEKYFTAPGSVLDLPCGTARLWPVFLSRGFQVTGGDISEAMLSVARRKFSENSAAHFEKVDAENLSFPGGSFDYSTSYRLMCHLPPHVRNKVLSEMARVTRKILVVNYHVEVYTPLYLFNRIFRPGTGISFPLREKDLRAELAAHTNLELLELRKLSWFEHSSLLAVLRKKDV